MVKLCLVVSSMHAGGAERVAATLVNTWAQRGDKVTLIITFSGGGHCFYDINPKVELVWLAEGIKPVGSSRTGFITRLMRPFQRMMALRRLIKHRDPDVVLSFLTNVNIATLLATFGLRTSVIVCERTNPSVINNVGLGFDFLRRALYRFAKRVNVQAQSTVRGLKLMVPAIDCVDVIPNPLPSELASAGVLVDYNPPALKTKQIVAMGRLSADKQFDVLIRIFARLASKWPDWRLIIWGEGPMRDELESQIESLGLKGRVQLPGRTNRPWTELATGQVFAMTSRVEGFPNALLEAMAIGLPAVVFDCPSGPADLAEGGVIKLIPLEDETGFVEALSQFMQNPDERRNWGLLAQTSVRERFGLDKIIDAWDQVFAQIKRGESIEYRP